ncbi:hypothetical protein L7F22_060866 [Adiantum nelumboides]|nr:hypothetical protein [Adiantum nelumboides]
MVAESTSRESEEEENNKEIELDNGIKENDLLENVFSEADNQDTVQTNIINDFFLELESVLQLSGSVTEGEKGQDRAYESKSLAATNPATSVDKKPILPGQHKEGSESTATVAEGDGGQSNRSIGVKKPKPLFDGAEDGTTYLDQSGFNPKRREFDKEYDNDAELPLAEMEFKETDTETDYELKLRMLHIYLARLVCE